MRARAATVVLAILVAGLSAATFVVLPGVARAATLYVGGTGPGNYTTIASAITAANSGDTVFVYAGTYPESLTLGKTISLVGEDRARTIIDGGSLYVGGASWANVTGFTFEGRGALRGTYLWFAQDCRIDGNIISNYTFGILLNSSYRIAISNNLMTGGGVYIQGIQGGGNDPLHWSSHTIGASNTVNGKPVLYRANVVGGALPMGAGQVILGNVTGMTVEDQDVSNASVGIEAGFSSGLTIRNNTVTANAVEGIALYHSTASSITRNEIRDGGTGLVLWLSDGNTAEDNTIAGNEGGVAVTASSRTVLRNNTLTSNTAAGIGFTPPGTDTSVANNTVTGSIFGIYTVGLGGVVVTGNIVSGNMHGILGGTGDTIVDNTASGNTVNGIEVDGPNNVISGNTVFGNPEGIRVYNTGGNVIAGNNVTGNGVGILLGSLTTGNTVLNNRISNNDYGVQVGALSTGDTISRNNISGSAIEGIAIIRSTGTIVTDNRVAGAPLGIHLYRSAGTRVYHNTILGNTQQAWDELSGGNAWDDGYPSGGNYWSDYGGVDNCSGPAQNVCPNADGIGDTAYTFSGGQDRYPLMTSPPSWTAPPSEPLNLRAAAGDRTIALTWLAPAVDGGSSVRNYEVYRGSAPGGEAFLVELGNVLAYSDTGLTNGVRYFYKVSAKNSVGEGPMSGEASATPATVPGPPASLQATAAPQQITLTWAAPADNGGSAVTGYRIFRATTSGGESYLTGVGNVLTYVDPGLTPGVTYYYEVSAVNPMGEGARSAEASATPPPPANQPPTVSIATPSAGDIVSGVYPVTGAAADPDGAVTRVEVRIDGGSWSAATGTGAWRHDWDTRGVPDGGHTLHVRAFDGADYSSVADVAVTVSNGIPPPQSVFAQGWFWALVALVVLVASLLLFVLWRDRRRPKQE